MTAQSANGSRTTHRVVVVGASFAGFTAALEVKRRLKDRVEVTVLDRRDHFTFIPSLIWLPFGARQASDVTFKLAPVLERKGIRFVHAAADRIDPDRRVVIAGGTEYGYDRLVVATGPRLAFERIPGLGPEGGYTQSVCNLDHAELAGAAWQRFLADPGPVVIGTAQGGSCFGASYEFLLNTRYQLERAGLAGKVPVTFISSEPFLGHFGLGGVGNSEERVHRMFDRLGIRGIPNASVDEVRDGEIALAGGEVLPFRYAMIVPPFAGVDAVVSSPGLANPAGFIPVTDEYRHPEIPEIFAAGVNIAIAPPKPTPVPSGVPKTGHMSEHMARVAAQNIAADLAGEKGKRLPIDQLGAICVLDGGDNGMAIKTDRVFGGGKTRVTAGPHAHLVKLAFEKAFMFSRRRGSVAF